MNSPPPSVSTSSSLAFLKTPVKKFTSIRIFVIKFFGTHSCGLKKEIPVVCDNPASTFIPAVLIEDFLFYSNFIT